MNTMKTFALMAVLTTVLVVAGGAMGGRGGMEMAFFFACIMNIGSYWFSDKIVLKMYGAKPVDSTQAPALHRIVRELSTNASIPMPKIYIMENAAPNAFATGRNPANGVVAVTTGIMNLLDERELRGVLAHELSHIKHRDILIGTIAATMAGAITMLANMAQWALIFGGRSDDEDSNPLAAIAMMIIAPLAAMLIQMAISRSREYMADEGAAKLSHDPGALASSLRKLQNGASKIPMEANPATAHMFIVNPLSGGGVVKLFSTHPPIEERIKRLEALKNY